jgi:hypothetical protein
MRTPTTSSGVKAPASSGTQGTGVAVAAEHPVTDAYRGYPDPGRVLHGGEFADMDAAQVAKLLGARIGAGCGVIRAAGNLGAHLRDGRGSGGEGGGGENSGG